MFLVVCFFCKQTLFAWLVGDTMLALPVAPTTCYTILLPVVLTVKLYLFSYLQMVVHLVTVYVTGYVIL